MPPATGAPEGTVDDFVRRMSILVVANEDTVGLIVAIGDAVVVVVIVVIVVIVVVVVVVVVVTATQQPNAYFIPS